MASIFESVRLVNLLCEEATACDEKAAALRARAERLLNEHAMLRARVESGDMTAEQAGDLAKQALAADDEPPPVPVQEEPARTRKPRSDKGKPRKTSGAEPSGQAS